MTTATVRTTFEQQLTHASYRRIDHDLDRVGIFAKAYTRYVGGTLTTVGMRIGQKPGHVVAFYGDWIVVDSTGTVSVVKDDSTPPCHCGQPIPPSRKKADKVTCSDRCRWDGDNHGPDDADGGDES